MRQKLLLNTCLCRYSRLSVSQKYCLQLCLCNPAGILPAPLCVRHFSSLPRLVPTWTLCLYLICRIGESHTGGLNCLPTNYASAQNVIGPRGTVRRHPHSFGFLCANEARRKKALRCAACGCEAASFVGIRGECGGSVGTQRWSSEENGSDIQRKHLTTAAAAGGTFTFSSCLYIFTFDLYCGIIKS